MFFFGLLSCGSLKPFQKEDIKKYSTKYNVNYMFEKVFIPNMIDNFIPDYPIRKAGVYPGLQFRDKRNFEYFKSYDGGYFDHLEYTNTSSPFEEEEFFFRFKNKFEKYYYEVDFSLPLFDHENIRFVYLSPILKIKNVDLSNSPIQFDPNEYPYLIQVISALKKDAVVQCYLLKMNKSNRIIAHKELFITGEIIEL